MTEKKEKKKPNIALIGKAAAAFAFPWLLCALYCMLRGTSVFTLYTPAAGNNDCLFYYKLVEGIASFGMPRGYFGFNESHALSGTLAAWSPVIFIPWVLWGLVFGWKFGSVIVSNLFFFSAALCGSVVIVRPKWKNLGILFTLLLAFPSIPIHLLNALPEAVIASFMILFFALALRGAEESKNTVYAVSLYVLGVILTLMRPYMVVLLFLPGFMLRKKKAAAVIFTILAAAVGLGGNAFIGHFFTSAYFEPLYDLTAVKLLLSGKIIDSVKYVKNTVWWVMPGIADYMKRAFGMGLTAGTQYVVTLFLMVALFILGLSNRTEKYGKTKAVNLTFAVQVFLLFAAIIVFLQKANEGGRHFWVFAVAGILLLSFNEWGLKSLIGGGILFIILGIFLLRGSMVPTDYDIPMRNDTLKAEISIWEEVYKQKGIEVTETQGYDNTVIWVLTDEKDGVSEVTAFGELFALPKGMGINCCLSDYVKSNISNLKCRYLATVSGGEIDKLCAKEGFEEIGRSADVVFYKRAD